MRLIYTVNDTINARKLAAYLISQGIDNRLEMATNTDWGSTNYGDPTCNIWIYDEDQLDRAMDIVEKFKENPTDPIYQKSGIKTEVQPEVLPPAGNEQFTRNQRLANLLKTSERKNREIVFRRSPSGSLTIGFLILCCIIFVICELTAPSISTFSGNFPYTPVAASETKKELLYDYPRAYELLDKIVKLYGIDKLQNPQDLPPEGQFLLTEFNKTPYWQGYYEKIVYAIKGEESPNANAPMFEKIREGQVWRLFSPALLHNDILHLVFNMIWLIVLGRQIEQRLSARRFFLLIILLGVFSNTLQYLMSGPNFLGFSGIDVGMLTFIWVRQKLAPWEGYPLERATILFMMYFILAMLIIQLASFYSEVSHATSISPGIANTAHFAGAALGALLGRLSFFSWKKPRLNGTSK